ncbi:hypothetical protein HPB48_000707 [Haemaphysalis longicornis]|uniref:Polyketide synthase-like phosphopantetheine-binding domain-containing protein n=1 Tax=Haemaphysalis longicornis TaxID=44386 RepID=A0A9J6FV27_HAELO|nr:hypothetical protein HPB48_000707 [Haemaphysalis longicornis]
MGADVVVGGTVPQQMRSCLEVMDRFLKQSRPIVSSFVKADLTSKAETKDKNDLVLSIMSILGVKDPSCLKPDMSLGELGMDSLMSVKVKEVVERDHDRALSMQEVRQLTVNRKRSAKPPRRRPRQEKKPQPRKPWSRVRRRDAPMTILLMWPQLLMP